MPLFPHFKDKEAEGTRFKTWFPPEPTTSSLHHTLPLDFKLILSSTLPHIQQSHELLKKNTTFNILGQIFL